MPTPGELSAQPDLRQLRRAFIAYANSKELSAQTLRDRPEVQLQRAKYDPTSQTAMPTPESFQHSPTYANSEELSAHTPTPKSFRRKLLAGGYSKAHRQLSKLTSAKAKLVANDTSYGSVAIYGAQARLRCQLRRAKAQPDNKTPNYRITFGGRLFPRLTDTYPNLRALRQKWLPTTRAMGLLSPYVPTPL